MIQGWDRLLRLRQCRNCGGTMGKFMDSPVQNLFRAFVVIQTLNSFAASAPVGIAPLSFVYTYEDSLEITLSHMTPYILADAT
jgi:Cys-tRNA synthase (O-phospho-L-seryl-tRNA:Cys-tRNA synthase)